ncbi:MAG TPA: DNA-processing protein DprA, partial [Ktedonobacteraceae bacterium]
IRKLSGVQVRSLVPKIEAGNVLLMSQFHPDAQWVVSRAMERNKVVTGLAQVVIIAEADIKGGTWEGANGALKQGRPLYVRQTQSADAINLAPGATLTGNDALIERGGLPLLWPTENMATMFSTLLTESTELQHKQSEMPERSDQLSLFTISNE